LREESSRQLTEYLVTPKTYMAASLPRKFGQVGRKVRQLMTVSNIRRAFDYVRDYGWRRFLGKVVEKTVLLFHSDESQLYTNRRFFHYWTRRNEPDKEQLIWQVKQKFDYEPCITIVVPCYKTPLPFLVAMLNSIKAQTYSNWQLCLTLSEMSEEAMHLVSEASQNDPRIVIRVLKENLGIAGNTNTAIELATGNYVGFADHDDLIAPWALFEVVEAINKNKAADFLYSDEDKVTANGKERHSPHFKPDWSPDLLRSYNYITHFVVVKKSLLEELGGIRSGFDGSQDYDFVLRATELAQEIVHIPAILYHWREHRNSTAANTNAKEGVEVATLKAVKEHLKRIKRPGLVTEGPFFGSVRISYELQSRPLVSIIIPNHNHAEDLRVCIDSILKKTTYENYEIIIMENHSNEPSTRSLYQELLSEPRIRLLKWEKPFNYSEINNDGALQAKGSVLLFLNNDIEVISPGWLEEMLSHLQWPENGIVGAKLYYPDKTVQHAGVVLGIGGIAGHPHKGFLPGSVGYFGRLAVPHNLSAVTAACMMVKRSVFTQVGGFDTGYPLAFNDVDLCLKVRATGYSIIWTPYAQLVHHESKTRGYEDTKEKKKRFNKEVDYFQQKWSSTLKKGDPFYNRNLTLEKENFSLKS